MKVSEGFFGFAYFVMLSFLIFLSVGLYSGRIEIIGRDSGFVFPRSEGRLNYSEAPCVYLNYSERIQRNGGNVLLKDVKLIPVAGTGSMIPTISYPTHLIEIPYENQDLCIGDIIVYERDDGNTTVHRIVDKVNDSYVSKGDNNNVNDDGLIGRERIRWIVVGLLYS